MKRLSIAIACMLMLGATHAQRLLSWTPEFPTDASSLTFTVDATKGNQGLLNFESGNSSNVYVHIGVLTNLSTSSTDWKYVKFTYGSSDPLAKATSLGNNKYSFTIPNIRSFFGVPAGETIRTVNVIFRNAGGSLKQVNSDGSDMYIPVYGASQFAVRLNSPASEPRYVPWPEPITATVGSTINIAGVSSANAALTLTLNGTNIATVTNGNSITATPTLTSACEQKIVLTGNNGTTIVKDSFSFFITQPATIAPLPSGAQEGINYLPGNTSVTLVLFAPNKSNVTVIGDFSNWNALCSNQMNKTADGNYYWITLTGLTPGVEYGYQYLVDNTIKIADPYTQKILDPNNDQYISPVTYPNLKPYPTGLTTDLVSIFQTAEPTYNWQATNYVKPDKKNLMIYELLIRDFTAQHSYQSLIDSFQYFKNLGINAIELMPVNEFDGNESWGYNPDFYFAPDKYYGTKNKLKEFIDKCHQNGMAVILDVVYNHCSNSAPEAKLYWDAANNRPAANNPWLNPSAPHPYSVFNDFNHTSAPTQYLVQRSIDHWLNEYKVDGFRFDLAKGFTQTVSTTTTVENYDASRVANLKRYYNGTIASHPDAYMILEFLGTLPAQEEQEYASYGFMLWGNNNPRYNQCTMGYASNSDISPVVYNSPQKGFTNPAEVGYMESHDEERTMFKNEQYGNANGTYNVKDLNTALAREEAAATVFFTVPGPKMIWQFEERGYDTSINYGGSNVANKPPYWEYMNNPNRRHLYDTYSKLLNLRLTYPAIFNNTTFTYDFNNGGGLVKTFQIADPSAPGKAITVVANFDVVAQTKAVTFQSTGDWTNYVSNGTGTGLNGLINTNFTLTNAAQSITLQPGEYHVFVSVPPCTTAAPTATTSINYCQNGTATVLSASGTNLLWYTASTSGTGSSTAPTPSTATVGSTTYYVSQTAGCESPRLAITVTVTVGTPAPGVVSPINVCQNAASQALSATGTGLLWYTSSTGGTGSSVAPSPSTANAGTVTYYVSQTLSCGEGPRAAIAVITNPIPSAPVVTPAVSYCQNATAVALTATGANLLWYSSSTGGTGVTTAPIPTTSVTGTTSFYVSQNNSGCEGPRAAITVTVSSTPNSPTVNASINYCQNATATALTATGTNLLWYAAATGGTGNSSAPLPSTSSPGVTNFYVSQTSGTCESPRSMITVTVDALPDAPVVTPSVSYCQNAVTTALSASGTGLLWFSSSSGGSGSSTAPTPSSATVGITNYYVSQANGCGQGPRSLITVTILPIPAVPSNLTATEVTVSSARLNWTEQGGAYFNVDYRLSGTSNWSSAASALQNNSVLLSNLLQGKMYDWRVSANCSSSNSMVYASSTFTTVNRNNGINGLRDGLGIKISPNPVTGTALIDYRVAGNGLVAISIYDMQGQTVIILLNKAQVAGQYYLNVTNELNKLSAGTYFLKIAQNKKSNYISFLKQ